MAAQDEKSGEKSGKLGFGSTNYAEHGCDTLSTRTWKETIKVVFRNTVLLLDLKIQTLYIIFINYILY